MTLTDKVQRELIERGFSRRTFGRIASVMAAGSTLPFYNEFAFAQASKVDNAPPDAVMINANENPMGPCKEALEAVRKIAAQGGRYLYGEADKVQKMMAEKENLPNDHVRIYPGSSAPLHQAVLAFTSPSRPYVMADPGYESGAQAAKFIGAKVFRVPLGADYAHDVKGMLAAAPNAGLFYICNPNNPTGTLTPREQIDWLIANKPAGSYVMLDEAYMHLAGDYFGSDLVKAGKDVIILRTFSKIYGMAGLRAGAVLARPDLIEKINQFSSNGMLPITGMAAASASLAVPTLIPERRKIIADIRNDVFAFLDKNKIHYVPSQSNCFMVDTRKPNNDVIMAMRKEKVYIGRPWPIWPTHVRVTVGTKEEMEKFKTAFLKVMSA